jgi:putative endonuclease
MGWHLYLLRCGDDSIYTGIATDVERRLAEHSAGAPKGAKSLRGRGPLRLAASCELADRSEASRLEARVKRLPRAAKAELAADSAVLHAYAREFLAAVDS